MSPDSPLHRARWYDLTQALSIFTPPWPGEMPLQVHFFKRLTGSYGGGQGANGQIVEWTNNTAPPHSVGASQHFSTSPRVGAGPVSSRGFGRRFHLAMAAAGLVFVAWGGQKPAKLTNKRTFAVATGTVDGWCAR